jgi:hypothetical protein
LWQFRHRGKLALAPVFRILGHSVCLSSCQRGLNPRLTLKSMLIRIPRITHRASFASDAKLCLSPRPRSRAFFLLVVFMHGMNPKVTTAWKSSIAATAESDRS